MNLNLILALTAPLIVFLVLLLRYRKALILLMVKVFYGKYSHQYVSAFKHFFVRSPFQYCFREELIHKFSVLMEDESKYTSQKTKHHIDFNEAPFGSSWKKIRKEKGEPNCFNALKQSEHNLDIKVAGYNCNTNGEKCQVLYYFMDNVLFMGEYVYKNVKFPAKERIIEKYALSNSEILPDNFVLLNSGKHIIHYINSGFTIDVKYIDKGNANLMEKLSSYYEQLESRFTSRKEELSSMIASASQL